MTVREQDFQNLLLVALSRDLDVRVWRQAAGEFHTVHGTVVKGSPKGSADITGVVIPDGLRLEIEVKAAGGRVRPDQARWATMCSAWGAVYCLVQYDATRLPEQNVQAGVEQVRAAIDARRSA